MIPDKIPVVFSGNIPSVFDNESMSVIELNAKVASAINALIDEMTSYEQGVNNGQTQQNNKIAQYKLELEEIVADYKAAIESEMVEYRGFLTDLYNKTLDVYNKTLLQISAMKSYVDNAVAGFGSVAQFTITDNGELTATVFNDDILISIGMSVEGRLEVTADV